MGAFDWVALGWACAAFGGLLLVGYVLKLDNERWAQRRFGAHPSEFQSDEALDLAGTTYTREMPFLLRLLRVPYGAALLLASLLMHLVARERLRTSLLAQVMVFVLTFSMFLGVALWVRR